MAGKARNAVRKKRDGVYHHGDLKTALKNAALRLVREKGQHAFSLNEASRLAGVSAGAPLPMFGPKEGGYPFGQRTTEECRHARSVSG